MAGTTTATTVTVPTQVKNLKAKSQTKKQITLTWDKITKNVTAYKVYMYNSKTKKWDYLGKSSTPEYIVKGLTAGTTYKFKVRAYKNINGVQHFGSYSSVLKTTTKTIAPTITKITAGSKKATVYWNKISSATGYKIYMATSKNGTYKQVGKSTKNTYVKYTKTGLTKGKTYYFKMRTYRTVSGIEVNSAYSEIKSVKVK